MKTSSMDGQKDKQSYHLNTLAIHAGQSPDPTTGAIMTPIYQTSTYVQDGPGNHKGYEYARTHNPTREALEKNLAALEDAEFGICFSSGCGAMSSLMLTFKSGDHFVVCDDVYGGTFRLFTKILSKFGLEFTFTDLSKIENLSKALKPNTKMVWIESPTNPTLKLIDIQKTAEIAHAAKALVLVDNTFMSPALQSPLALGADIVLHSTTKYLGGHSDTVGGFVGTNLPEIATAVRFNQNSVGAVPGPQDCFLALRGTKTLGVRMQRHSENGMEIARFLEKHPMVEAVSYPGLPTHPQHELAKKQMKGFGGMLTFVIKGGLPAATKFLKNTQLFACAESLGGVESLIEHPAIMTHASVPKEQREALGILDGFIRVSVGIENIDDLKNDLDRALRA